MLLGSVTACCRLYLRSQRVNRVNIFGWLQYCRPLCRGQDFRRLFPNFRPIRSRPSSTPPAGTRASPFVCAWTPSPDGSTTATSGRMPRTRHQRKPLRDGRRGLSIRARGKISPNTKTAACSSCSGAATASSKSKTATTGRSSKSPGLPRVSPSTHLTRWSSVRTARCISKNGASRTRSRSSIRRPPPLQSP